MRDPEFAKHINALLDAWEGRAKTQGWKPGSATYTKHRLEFLIGACSWDSAITGKDQNWPVLLLAAVGRPTDDLRIKL